MAGLIGIIAGLFMRQQAKPTKAQAAQEVAESAKLKKLLAESLLDNAALKDVLGRKW